MKKFIAIAATLFLSTTVFTACDREDVISESELPKQSKTFLKTHFDGVPVVRVIKEIDGFDKDYSAYLQNGFEVDFRRSGAWDQVEGHIEAMPER